MFAWVGQQFTAVLGTYVLGVVTTLMAAITPVALSALTLWVALYGWAVLRNEVQETVPSFLWKAVKISLTLVFALQAGVYVAHVAASADALALGVAKTLVPPTAPAQAVTTPYALLDTLNDQANEQVSNLMKEAGLYRLDLMVAAITFSLGTAIYLVIALFIVTLSKVLLTFVIAVGPIFILCLAWRPTQRFFDSWLSMVLNAVVLTWFSFFALGLSVYVGGEVFAAIEAGGGFLGPAFNALAESLRYCVLMILLGVICFQAPGLASALTGGVAVQQGVQMVQNVLMVAGLHGRRLGGTAPAATEGGAIRAGVGLAYQTGRWVGAIGARRVGPTAPVPAYRASTLRSPG